MVRCIIRRLRASRNWVTFLCVNRCACFPVSTNTLLALFPRAGLANSGDARSPATSWQTQMLLFCDKRSPKLSLTFGRVSSDHLELTQCGPLYADMTPEAITAVSLVSRVEFPFSISRSLGFVAAAIAAAELWFFRKRGEIRNKYWPCLSVCVCQIPENKQES